MTNTDPNKRCLLIIQRRFHSFGKFIRDALSAKGYIVEVANDEYPESLLGRIMGKIQFPLIFEKTYKHIRKHYLDGKHYDLAIIIKGRGISKKLIQHMRSSASRIIGYNWDTFDNNPSPLRWLSLVDKYATFDYIDASRNSIPVIELFSPLSKIPGESLPRYNISAVGKNYPDRLAYIDKVLSILKPKRFFIRLYENNMFAYLLNFCRHPILFFKYRKHISLKTLSDHEYITLIQQSEFTIDYAHARQTGITMRCFECLNLKTKIITNNQYLNKSKYFNPTNSIIFAPATPYQDLVNKYNSCKNQISTSAFREINSFIEDLLA